MTLREGLISFYIDNEEHLSHNTEEVTEEAKAFFAAHDVLHVLFGCDISLYGEGCVKFWTLFGTSLSWWDHIIGYRSAEAYRLAGRFTVGDVMTDLWRLIVVFPVILWRASMMTKRWGWHDYQQYLDVPLERIRAEYNIKVSRR